MFRGVHNINLDAKGRMAVPARYRQLLHESNNGALVVTIDTEERCLLVYPLQEWEPIQAKLEALPSFNPAARRIQRLIIGHATDVDMDANGRVLLPSPLREYAGLNKKVVMMGQGNKFELWDEDHWSECRQVYLEAMKNDTDMPDELMNISL
ncbi:division/cell wall cluster transcriptional repressor MraZ [Bermanella sp. R86510]|uniref:division/cell wall cluster transcriptional repressor MraZ n=1 Tax=unclassified Bermanella TaxID=2627862 RepID=UPI0037C96662